MRHITPKINGVNSLLVHLIGMQSLHLQSPQRCTLSSGSVPSEGRAVGGSSIWCGVKCLEI